MSKQSETITFIPIEKLIPFRDHPFQIRDDEQMKMITESIRSEMILQIMSEKKKPECWNLVFPMNKVSKYFPKSYTPKRMEETIYGLLEGWRNDQSRREKA